MTATPASLEPLEPRRLFAAVLTTVATFPGGPAGTIPATPLAVDAKGDLYGTTSSGGADGSGAVFELPAGSTTPVSLAPLLPGGEQVAGPTGAIVVDPAGDVFGAAQNGGGLAVAGEVYEVVAGSGRTTPLKGFGFGNGPQGGLVADRAGDLFGTAPAGTGVVFEITAGAHAYVPLATLAAGSVPRGDLAIDPAGDLYGTTTFGGTAGLGTVYRVDAATHALTTLASFTGPTTGGTEPQVSGLALDPAGDLFGLTYGGGSDFKTRVFELPAGSHAVRTVATFADGAGPQSAAGEGLLVDAAGDLFGTSAYGVDAPAGGVFEVAAGSSAITTVAALPADGSAGEAPLAGLAVDAAGTLYGTTTRGGTGGGGTAFQVTGAGFVTATPTPTPTPTPTAAIAGTVDRDLTGNGATADDAPLAGVRVTLFRDANRNGKLDPTDPALTTVTTAATGAYRFASLPAGAYLVAAATPAGDVRTAPLTSGDYAVTLAAGQRVAGDDFDEFRKPTSTGLSGVTFIVNGVAYASLAGHVIDGATVSVRFTVTEPGLTFSLVAYTAPASTFSAATADQQRVSQQATATYANPGTYALTVRAPASGHLQVDFVHGTAIGTFGPAGSNLFYTPQGRLLSSDNE